MAFDDSSENALPFLLLRKPLAPNRPFKTINQTVPVTCLTASKTAPQSSWTSGLAGKAPRRLSLPWIWSCSASPSRCSSHLHLSWFQKHTKGDPAPGPLHLRPFSQKALLSNLPMGGFMLPLEPPSQRGCRPCPPKLAMVPPVLPESVSLQNLLLSWHLPISEITFSF